MNSRRLVTAVTAVALLAAACGTDDTIETADDDAETTADDHTLDDGPVETAERSRSRRK